MNYTSFQINFQVKKLFSLSQIFVLRQIYTLLAVYIVRTAQCVMSGDCWATQNTLREKTKKVKRRDFQYILRFKCCHLVSKRHFFGFLFKISYAFWEEPALFTNIIQTSFSYCDYYTYEYLKSTYNV